MPLYEYQCDACGAQFELIRKFSDPPLQVCPTCGAERVRKLLSSPAFQFKGSGWYVTDYARKTSGGESGTGSKSSSESNDSKDTGKSGSGAEGAKAESAPASADKSPGDKSSGDKPAAPAPAASPGKDKS
jgi:putative FmdB family regulatory protein